MARLWIPFVKSNSSIWLYSRVVGRVGVGGGRLGRLVRWIRKVVIGDQVLDLTLVAWPALIFHEGGRSITATHCRHVML